jgi:hypothetical protein
VVKRRPGLNVEMKFLKFENCLGFRIFEFEFRRGCSGRIKMVGGNGIEPLTPDLSDLCSTG